MTSSNIHPVDLYAGQRLRQGRGMRKLSQAALGSRLLEPITFQQVQKYERGINRIAVSRLFEFAEILQLPVSFFLPEANPVTLPILSAKEASLLRDYNQLPPTTQIAITALLNAMRRD
jgi:transcriptional regulator with XRE-family HTH domain